jgi:hypothetical protein
MIFKSNHFFKNLISKQKDCCPADNQDLKPVAELLSTDSILSTLTDGKNEKILANTLTILLWKTKIIV